MASRSRYGARTRERRYTHRIPGRDRILEVVAAADAPLTLESLGAAVDIRESRQLRALEQRLKAMVRDGQLIRNRAFEYGLSGRIDLVTGVVARVRPGAETDDAIKAHGIPDEWPGPVIKAAAQVPRSVSRTAASGREDLRDIGLVTIDGADARDFDDAVHCEPRDKGWRLIVAIADVSHYVELGSAFDREARVRGTSVYFPDRVVPMLPESLSNGLCSLNPGVDRLCVACEMEVSAGGRVTRSRFFEAVMRSAARLTYSESAALLGGRKRPGEHVKLVPGLEHLRAVWRALEEARRRRGAIDFDLPQTAIELDASGKVRSLRPTERLLTHRIIEECMIAANVEAAKQIRRSRLPSLYRVHVGPDPDRIEEISALLRMLRLDALPPGKPEPRKFSRLIAKLAGQPEAELVEKLVLRSMNQARYQPGNVGHFGLALGAYAHFTSPIRRYPDLLVHRALKWSLRQSSKTGGHKGYPYSLAEMERLGEHCSRTERRADEAVWDVEEQLKCAYMKGRVGEPFEVVVTHVAPFGLFVRVPDLQVDGLVHASALPGDYYRRHASGMMLEGERGGARYLLADTLEVRLAGVNVEERKIDFVPVDSSGPAKRSVRGRRRRRE